MSQPGVETPGMFSRRERNPRQGWHEQVIVFDNHDRQTYLDLLTRSGYRGKVANLVPYLMSNLHLAVLAERADSMGSTFCIAHDIFPLV